MNTLLKQKFNNLCEFEKKLINSNKSFSKNLKSNIILTNNFINDNNVTLSTLFKKFDFNLIIDYEIYEIERA